MPIDETEGLRALYIGIEYKLFLLKLHFLDLFIYLFEYHLIV